MNSFNLVVKKDRYKTLVYDYASTLAERIADHSARVTVIGQDYVGLPLAVEFCKAGFKVIGIDIGKDRVKTLNSGRSLTSDVKDEELAALRNSGYYEASWDFSVLKNSDVILICLPASLLESKDPDIFYVLNTIKSVGKYLCPGQLIILESTTYADVTEELLLPLFDARCYTAGEDIFLAFSPDPVEPGNKKYAVKDIPKVTGGISPTCTRLAALLYRQIVGKVIEV